MPRGVTSVAAGAVALALGLGACGVRPLSPYAGVRIDPAALVNPFAPVTMEVHPLTRIDRDASGALWIICHIELRDVWGDPAKGTGQLQLQLYRPIGGRLSPHGVQELTWDVDLSDLERNASHYDSATRTYRLPLREPPAWLADPPEQGSERALLRAVLTTAGPQGEELVLEHEFALH